MKKTILLFMVFCAFILPWQGNAQITGSTCGDPLMVTTMPFNDAGNTSSYGNHYSSSDVPPVAPGAVTEGTGSSSYLGNGDDVVYSYIAGSNGSIDINTTHTGGSSWNALWVFTGCPFSSTVGYHTGTTGTMRSIPNLPVTAGETYYIVISNWDAGAVDYTISITGPPPPSCLPPNGLGVSSVTPTSVDLEWNDNASATQWDIEWGAEGFTPTGTPTISSTTTNPYPLSGLSPLTQYDFYVRADCGSGDQSFWSGPYTFSTVADCTIYTLSVTANDGYVCDEGSGTLTATASGGGDDIYWYDAAVGGNLLGAGAVFETPDITQTTSFWAAEVVNGGPLAGQANANPTTFSNSTSNSGGLLFTVNNPIVIVDVEVFGTSTTGGDITIELRDIDNGNATIASTTATITGGGTAASPIPHTIPLDFVVPAAGNYRLVRTAATASVGMGYVTAANSNFPYPLGNSGEVTGGASATSTSTWQYFFFNWTIKEAALCESSRDEAIATVVTVEEVEASATTTQVDPGNSTTLTATSTNANYTYVWTWDSTTGGGTGTGTGASITVTPTAHTTYTVTATDSGTGCIAIDEIDIYVFNTSLCNTLDITSTTGAYVCDEGTAILTAVASNTGDEIYWFDAAVGGNRVGSGTSFETPELTQTTSYWAAEVLEEGESFTGVGIVTPSGTGTNSTVNYGMEFTVTEPATIVSVDVLSTANGGDLSIALYDTNDLVVGNHIAYHTEAITAGAQHTITLNFDVPAAGTYRLVRAAQSQTIALRSQNTTGTNYPYPIGTIGQLDGGHTSLTGNTNSGQYMFYNWTFSTAFALCESPREEAIATVVTVDEVEASATTTQVDPGNSTTLTATSTNSNYMYAWTWDSSTGGGTGTGTGASITVTPTAHTTYTVTATDTVTGCVAIDEIEILVFNTALCNTLDITSTTDEYICNEGTAILTATASGTGDEIYWYDAATGGNLVGTGANFETPELTQTTSYWAAEVLEEGSSEFVGPLDPSIGTSNSSSLTNHGVNFIVHQATSIVSVDIFPTASVGTSGTIEIREGTSVSGNIVATVPYTTTVSGTVAAPVKETIMLNVQLQPGTYTMGQGTGVNLVRNTAGASYPYISPSGSVEITGNTFSGTGVTYWYFFYNWEVGGSIPLCESPREEAIATVVNPEEVDVTATDTQVDPGNSTTLTATSTNSNYTYAWTWDSATGGGTGTGTGASITVTPSAHTVYAVTATDSVTGCTSESEIQIVVFNTADCITLDILTTTGDIVCVGETADLTATGSGTGDNIYWYDAAVDGNFVGEGTSFETPPLTATTSYWAAEVLTDGLAINPIETIYTVGSSNSVTSYPAYITFAIENTNSESVTLTQLDNYMPANTTRAHELWYHPTNLAGSPGSIDASDGWILVESSQTTTSGGTLGISPVLENISVTIPANTTWRFALVATANISGPTNFYYWGSSTVIASPNNFSDGGVNLLVNDHSAGGTGNVGYGSGNTPRGFTGVLHFAPQIILCESTRMEAIATVTSDAAPVGDATQNFIAGETLADLTVTGTNLTWYSDAAGTNSIPDTTLLVDATTYYVSQTVNGCESQLLAITVTEAQPCDAPTNVVVGTLTTTTAEFSWTGSPHETDGYNWVVMEDGDDPLTDTPVDSGTAATGITTASASGLTANTDYDFYVQTNCGAGNLSTWTGPVSFTTLGTPCIDPSALVISNITHDSADVSWTENGTATEWEIEYGLSGFTQGSGTVIVDNDGTLGETLAGLDADEDYDVYVRAICSSTNASAWIGPESFTTLEAPCADPSALVISNITHDSADVSWTENGTATEWEIEYGLSGFTQGSGTVIVDNDGTLGETITGLDADESYDVYVRAICSSTNTSAWIGPVSFTTLEAPCADPSAIVISNVTYDSADVSWTENGTATEWEIEYGLSGFTQGSGTVIVDNDGTLGETLTGLDADESYDVYVRAICSSTNASAWIGPESFITGSIGIADHDFSGFAYYPNPMDEVLNISSTNEMYEISIFNILGQKIVTHKMVSNTGTINVSHLASGSYMMQVMSETGQVMYVRLLKE